MMLERTDLDIRDNRPYITTLAHTPSCSSPPTEVESVMSYARAACRLAVTVLKYHLPAKVLLPENLGCRCSTAPMYSSCTYSYSHNWVSLGHDISCV